jgi:hypothetical protein
MLMPPSLDDNVPHIGGCTPPPLLPQNPCKELCQDALTAVLDMQRPGGRHDAMRLTGDTVQSVP